MLFGTLASLMFSRIADVAGLTHRPHGCPSPRTAPTNAWKTRARSARPASVRLSRTRPTTSASQYSRVNALIGLILVTPLLNCSTAS